VTLTDLRHSLDFSQLGKDMYQLVAELYPICRSITGDGVRETLTRLHKHIPLTTHEVPSGTQVFDWTVPKEWNIRDAYIRDSRGVKIVEFKESNLHVMSYSVPVDCRMTLRQLRPHLFTLPDHQDWIPYRTSYYEERWGFCLRHSQLLRLRDDEEYDVLIDSTLQDGYLTYAESFLPGDSPDEILISAHVCHPSLCNDNLSGVSLATFMAKSLATIPHRFSYRFLFIPGTIGAITWLSRNESQVSRIRHGIVLTCVGDSGAYTYKKSRRGAVEIDRAFTHVLKHLGSGNRVLDFVPYGYDERQFCSPGFNLPVGCFMRTPHGQFPEYHTSADNLEFIHPRNLSESLRTSLSVFDILENNRAYLNQNPKCEPQLGKRGLYRAIGGSNTDTDILAMLWVLNLSDGEHALLDIAESSGIPFDAVTRVAALLEEHGLLSEKSK